MKNKFKKLKDKGGYYCYTDKDSVRNGQYLYCWHEIGSCNSFLTEMTSIKVTEMRTYKKPTNVDGVRFRSRINGILIGIIDEKTEEI